MWTRLLVCALLLLICALCPSECSLEFVTEPFAQLVKPSELRAVFRCEPQPASAEIRWLFRGQPVHHSKWFKVAGQKLTVHLGKADNSSSRMMAHHLDLQEDVYFQCEIRHKGKVLISAPAKLIVAVLKPFHHQPDVHISAIVGNTAVIPCDPPYSVPTVVTEFIFNGSTIKKSSGTRHLMESGDLQIMDVKPENSGEYICVANNPYLAESVTSKRKVFLHVEDPVQPKAASFVRSPRALVSVAIGSNVTMECAATGHPAPSVIWRKGTGHLPSSRHHQLGGNLVIISVRKEDAGKYFCEVSNSAGDMDYRTTSLEIQETPHFVHHLKNAVVQVGHNLSLNCVVRGHPKPILQWLHNGKELALDTKKSHLTIQNVSHKHSGIYQCFATNELGTVYSSALINVASGNRSLLSDDLDDYDDYDSEDPPSRSRKGKGHSVNQGSDKDPYNRGYRKRLHKKKHSKGVKLIPPSKPEVTRLSNTSVMVRWSVVDEGLPINFFKVQYKEVGKHKSNWMTIDEDIATHIHSFAVTNLRTGGAYRFRLAAVYSNHDNTVGPVSTKFVLHNHPPMEKPSVGPLITYAEAASPSAIHLHWEYNDIDSVPIEGFFIHYRATHTAGKYLKVTVLGSNTRSHIISHLLADTGYDMKMQCFNTAGTSDFSNIYTSKTNVSDVVTPRNRKGQHDEEIDTEHYTEPVSSKNSHLTLYITLGAIFAVVSLLVMGSLVLCCIRRRQSRRPKKRQIIGDGSHKIGNGHINSNGYHAGGNKMNISVNPLSHFNAEIADKDEELEEMISNNNEIIRLQTFRIENGPQAESLLNGSNIESTLNESDQSVIAPSDPEAHTVPESH